MKGQVGGRWETYARLQGDALDAGLIWGCTLPMGSSRFLSIAFLLCLSAAACAHAASNFDLGMDEVLAGQDAEARLRFEAALNDPGDEHRARAELNELDMRAARAVIERLMQDVVFVGTLLMVKL